jgi:DNA-binding NarL/FixJ family response regulator
VLELSRAGLEVDEVAQRLLLTPHTVRSVLERATAHAGG